jgi:hypothetical protein
MYGIWGMREIWVMSRIPTWYSQNRMGYEGVWALREMGYKGVDCIQEFGGVVLVIARVLQQG